MTVNSVRHSFLYDMSRSMRFPTMWYVRPAKPQISLRIRAFWSEPLLVAWIFYGCKVTDRTSFGVSNLKRALHRLVWVYTCQNATVLEITCHGSYLTITIQNTSSLSHMTQSICSVLADVNDLNSTTVNAFRVLWTRSLWSCSVMHVYKGSKLNIFCSAPYHSC